MFVVGHNMVGYMPESEPFGYADWTSAQSDMIDYLDREGDYLFESGQTDLADELTAEMESLNLCNGPEWGTIVGNVSYWITSIEDEDWKGEVEDD